MASSINASLPVQGQATTQSVRDNFAAAKSEIEALQDKATNLSSAGILQPAALSSVASIASQYREKQGLGTLSLLNTLATTQLSDFSPVTATASQVPIWNASASRYEPGTISGGGGLSSVPRATSSNVQNPNSSNATGRFPAIDDIYDAFAEVSLTSTSNSVAWDMATGINFKIDTLGENTTIANPTNKTIGKTGRLRAVQDATGSRTIAWGTDFEFRGGTAPTATTSSGGEDIFYYDVLNSSRVFISANLDIRS